MKWFFYIIMIIRFLLILIVRTRIFIGRMLDLIRLGVFLLSVVTRRSLDSSVIVRMD